MLPRALNYNNKIYNSVQAIILNDGAFWFGKNGNELVYFDFTRIASLLSNLKREIKQPTAIEFRFIMYIHAKIQEKINNGELNSNIEVMNAIIDINRYINTTSGLLESLKNTNSVSLEYFNSLMNGNQYFKLKYPEYDEQAVTMILMNPQQNLDIDKLVESYLNDFNLEQINLLLSNFNLNENQIRLLNERKQNLDINTNNSNSKANLGKRKTFSLPGFKENKESAFIDTLLLSFTVGIFCGIYLMYFVLTIMS